MSAQHSVCLSVGAGATLPEALHEQATENAVKDEVPSTTDEDNGDTPRPTPSTPAAPSLENKEVATNIDVQKKMPSAIQNHAPSTPLTLPPAATVQEEPATAASLVGSDSFTTWMNCSKDADLDTMLFGRLRIPIMAQVCFTSRPNPFCIVGFWHSRSKMRAIALPLVTASHGDGLLMSANYETGNTCSYFVSSYTARQLDRSAFPLEQIFKPCKSQQA